MKVLSSFIALAFIKDSIYSINTSKSQLSLFNFTIPFIIFDKDKLFYYRGLKEYQGNREKGYLIDTCLNAQDQYTEMIKYYIGNK